VLADVRAALLAADKSFEGELSMDALYVIMLAHTFLVSQELRVFGLFRQLAVGGTSRSPLSLVPELPIRHTIENRLIAYFNCTYI
jgi:hypothetical protein